MQKTLPFYLYRRENSPYWYVRFKNAITGKLLPAVSTKQTTRTEAVRWAYSQHAQQKETTSAIESRSLIQLLQDRTLTPEELNAVISSCARNGVKVTVSRQNKTKAADYLLNFWNWETSDYIKEKLRKEHSIHKKHTKTQTRNVERYWLPFLKDKLLNELTKQDINNFMNALPELNGNTKNQITRSGTTAFHYAYLHEEIDADITEGIVYFSTRYKQREILTPEIAQAVFSKPWKDRRAELANILSMCTGLRAGEIQALRLRDIGIDCIYVNRSWNETDGFKVPKNTEVRKVCLPFPEIIEALKSLAQSNPFGWTLDTLVFWSGTKNPMDSKVWLKELRRQLIKIGMNEEETMRYKFHSWRHFYTTYMLSQTNEQMLRKQTGHKTMEMLEHYAEHQNEAENRRIKSAQIELFGNTVQLIPEIKFAEEDFIERMKHGKNSGI